MASFLMVLSLQAFATNLSVKLENSTMQWPTYIQVFKTSDGFPTDMSKAVLVHRMDKDVIEVKIPIKKSGKYAISIFQDKNGNKKLDTNWIGIPREPVGVSNNAKGSFGPPSFEDCVFEYQAESPKVLTIKLSEI